MTSITTASSIGGVDWDCVEQEYRSGSLSARQICAKHGIERHLFDAKAQSWIPVLEQGQADNSHDRSSLLERKNQVDRAQRRQIAGVRRNVEQSAARLLEQGIGVRNPHEAATLANASCDLVLASNGLIELERKTYNLDDNSGGATAAPEFIIKYVEAQPRTQ